MSSTPSGFRFWLPDNWSVRTEGNTVAVADAKEQISAVFTDEPSSNFNIARIQSSLSKSVKNLTMTKPKPITINQMQGTSIDASGKMEGIPVKIGIFNIPKNNSALTITIVTSADRANSLDAIKQVLNSVQGPIPPPGLQTRKP